MASCLYCLVPFITLVITQPMSVSPLKFKFQKRKNMCILFLLHSQRLILRTDFTEIYNWGLPEKHRPWKLAQRSPLSQHLAVSTWGTMELLTVTFTWWADRQIVRLQGAAWGGQEGRKKYPMGMERELFKAPDETHTPFRQRRWKWAPSCGLEAGAVCPSCRAYPTQLLVCTAIFRRGKFMNSLWTTKELVFFVLLVSIFPQRQSSLINTNPDI